MTLYQVTLLLEICSGQLCDGRADGQTDSRTDKPATICSPFGEHNRVTKYLMHKKLCKTPGHSLDRLAMYQNN